eukprot:1153163-Pelagomonas_calceolata.AAC.1
MCGGGEQEKKIPGAWLTTLQITMCSLGAIPLCVQPPGWRNFFFPSISPSIEVWLCFYHLRPCARAKPLAALCSKTRKGSTVHKTRKGSTVHKTRKGSTVQEDQERQLS